MKRAGVHVFTCFILCVICLLLVPFSSAKAGYSYGLKLFTQDSYTGSNDSPLPGYSLKGSGCCLFSFAHAIQWAKQQSLGNDVIKGLRKKAAPYPNPPNLYCDYAQSAYGLKTKKAPGTQNNSGLMKLFNDGYALVIYLFNANHCVCAVDYVICNADGEIIVDDGKTIPKGCTMYVHIVDSSPATSTNSSKKNGCTRTFTNDVFTINADGKMVKKSNYSYSDTKHPNANAASSYWVDINKANDHKGTLYVQGAVSGKGIGGWNGHQSLKYDDYGPYYFKFKSNGHIYGEPATSSSNKIEVNKDFVVIIDKKYTGDYSEWVGTKDGRFIRESDLTDRTFYNQELDKYTSREAFSSTVRPNNDNTGLYYQPYASSICVYRVNKNTDLSVKAIILNNANPKHYWLEVNYQGGTYYLCANNVYEYFIGPRRFCWTDGTVTVPEGKRDKGKGINFVATIKTATPMTNVTGLVLDANNNPVKVNHDGEARTYSKTISFSNPTYSFKLGGSVIDTHLKIGWLNEGAYRFAIDVTYKKYKNVTSDTVYPIEEITERIIVKEFTIGNATPLSSDVKVTGLTLSENSLEIPVGGTYNIAPTVTPSTATNTKVEWSSSDTSVATVKDGKVTAVGRGTAIITASALGGNNVEATCTITVIKKVNEVVVSPSTLTIYVGDSAKQLSVTVNPSDATIKDVEWISSNTNVATVDNTGKVTARAVGTTKITAKAKDGSSKQGICNVEVLSYVDSVSISGSDTVNVGASIKLSPTILPEKAKNKNLLWTSSDETIATVDADGKVAGIRRGSVTITAKATDRGTIIGTKTITVKQPVTGITLSGKGTVLRGESTSLTTVIAPSNANNKTITWSSEKPAIAEVNNGVITAKSVGSTTIWAIATDNSGTKASFYVTVEEPVAEITISGEELVPVDGTIQLSTTIFPANAGNKSVSWSVDHNSIATISNHGILKGVQAGTVTVTATASDGSGVYAEYSVRVVKQLIAVQISGDSSVYTGQEKQLIAVVTSDQSLDDTGVIWSSNDESVVTVTSDGKIRGVGNGTAIITATSKAENYYSASHTVKVTTLVSGITITGNSKVDESNDIQLSANITPTSATNKKVVWTSSDSAVATVDSSGKVYAVSEGTAVIEASATDGSGKSGTFEIIVYPLPHSITVNGETSLLVEETAQLTATVLPKNARNKNVVWSSSDETIATVNAAGLVTAVGNGKVTITGTAEGNNAVFDTHLITITTLVSSIELTAPVRINVGDTAAVMAEILPVTASNQVLEWCSSDEELAIVDSEGYVTAIAPGFVTITASATDGSGVVASVEIEVFLPIQSVFVDVEPLGYVGKVIFPNVHIYPDNASNQILEYSVDNENVAVIESAIETNGPVYYLNCKRPGLVQVIASATDGSGVSGQAYVLISPYTELRDSSQEYTVYSDGQSNGLLGTVFLTSDCAYRAADDKYGANWNIEHISGEYASAISINENVANYNGFSLASSADLNLLRINRTGTDVYRVSCTINDQIATCDVTVHAIQPSVPLPSSVSLTTGTYNAQVGEAISINTDSTIIQPTVAALPSETEVFLNSNGSFNRYAQVSKDDNTYCVTFSKAGIYSAYLRYSGANYQYDADVQFVITSTSGTVPPEVEKITINSPVKYMLVGETSIFDINMIPSAADDTTLLWSSSDPDVVSVSSDGILTALQTGTSIVTVSADNGVSATGFVAVTETLLSIDWNDDEVIEVYVGGSARTVIQRVYLSPRASAQITEAPTWSLKRIEGNNLTLTCEPITSKDSTGHDLYGCAIILKSVSDIGMTEYELTCSDGLYSTSNIIKVNANEIESKLPSMISWANATFTGRVNELLSIRPVVQCWPEGTALPDSALISVEGDQYWKTALNIRDYAISRNAMTFSFNEPGVYTANCIYSCSNMRYLVPITVRIVNDDGIVPVRATDVTLSENEISIQAGENMQLRAVIAPEDATNKVVTWQSRDTSIATVSADGKVTGIRNGRTGILCVPSDPNLTAIECIVVVEDTFTITQYTEMDHQYLQGNTGYAIAGFALSNGTKKRIQAEGLEPTWSFTRVSGHSSEVELKEYKGVQYLNVTSLLSGGSDVYRVTCVAGNYTWTGNATLTVEDLGTTAPSSVSLAQTEYAANIGEEITLNFTPVCTPARAKIPSVLMSDYIGIGNFYDALIDDYHMSLFDAGDMVTVAFKKPGRYILSRQYTGLNLTYVTECVINVMGGDLSLLKCTDSEPVVYIGGKSSIATSCIISDTSIEDLYEDEITWKAERLSGDCLTVALRADQSSASLYVVNAKEAGEEVWRVSCSFRGITDYVDVTIHAVIPHTDLPDSVSLYQSEFSGMIGNRITVPLAVQCEPEGTMLPSNDEGAWSFTADRNTSQNANWSIANNQLVISFKESGYYGGQLKYVSGNVSYNFQLGFAITDEDSILSSPESLALSLSKEIAVVYPEGDTDIAIVDAALTESGSSNNMPSIAAYAENKNAVWSLQIISGNACNLSIGAVSPSAVHIILGDILGMGDVNYRITCTVEGNQYAADGTVHVATSAEARPQPEVKKNYFMTPIGTVLTIDASFYDKTSNVKLCSGNDSIWDNSEALAAMGYEYETSGDSWLTVFYETGVYTTIVSNRIGNLPVSQEIKIVVYRPRILPANPSIMIFPVALTEIEAEAFVGIKTNVIDLRGTKIERINSRAFADNTDLIKIYIPASVQYISDDAFIGCSDFEICCVEGSDADIWAKRIGYIVNYDMD